MSDSVGAAAGGGPPPPAFARDCRRFFAARLQAPPGATAAVLGALELGAPYPLAWAAALRARELGVPRARALRLGLVAETLRAGLRTCDKVCRGEPLPSRIERAERVLAADALLTLAYELSADLGGPEGRAARLGLQSACGAFFSRLASAPRGHGAPAAVSGSGCASDRAASEFLEAALRAEGPR